MYPTLMASFLVSTAKSQSHRHEFFGSQFRIKNRFQIYNRANMLKVQWPNQSLNLTEPAVDEFAARKRPQAKNIKQTRRAMKYMELTHRRRSLAPVPLCLAGGG